MANGLINIRALRNGFSGTNRKVADFIVSHAGEVPFISVHELARRSRVSVASASRFARTVGYRNVRQFKAELGRDALKQISGTFEVVGQAGEDRDIIERVFRGNIRSLEETLQILDADAMTRAARAMAHAPRVLFMGIGGSASIARNAALRFTQLDVEARAYADAYEMVQMMVNMKKGDVAFGISHSGRSSVTVNALRLAREGGALTLGMSNYLKSPLHDASDIFFLTSFPESSVKAAALSSQIAQLCIVDALYLLVARYRRVSPQRVERLNRCVEQFLREDAS